MVRMPEPTAKEPVKNYITPSGLQRLRDELRFLLTRERPAVKDVVAWAAGNGDRSENADYQDGNGGYARSMGGFTFSRSGLTPHALWTRKLREWGGRQRRFFFGATVRYLNAVGTERAASIVGADEVDSDCHHISWVSPLARALMNAGPGDRVVLHAPAGDEHLQILEARDERIPVKTFSEPPGAEAAPKSPPRTAG